MKQLKEFEAWKNEMVTLRDGRILTNLEAIEELKENQGYGEGMTIEELARFHYESEKDEVEN